MRHYSSLSQGGATATWINQAGGDWSDGANWSGGAVPDSSDTVTINTKARETVTFSGGTSTIFALKVGNDVFSLSGGSLSILRSASFAHGFTQTGGSFSAHLVSILGAGILTGGSAEGSTVFSIKGTTAISNYALGGAAQIKNTKTINQTGNITIGDNTGVGAGIVNTAGAIYAIAGDVSVYGGATSASIVNAGTLAKTAGNNTSVINVSVTSTGTISVLAGGDLQFNGPSNTIKGVLTGAGEISFAGSGGTTLTLGNTTLGTLGLYNSATLSLVGGASILNGALSDQSNGNNLLSIGAGRLTLNGDAAFESMYGSANVSGTGSLVLNGATTAYGADFGGKIKVVNNGDFSVVGGGMVLGDASGGVVSFTNAATGTLEFTVDAGFGNGNNASSVINNAGLITKSGGDGVSNIGVVLNSQSGGTISSNSGSLQISDTLSNAGAISGAGQVDVTGSATLLAGTTLTVGQFGIYNAGSVTLATSLAYGGILTEMASFGTTTLALGGNTLTLNGSANFGGYYGTAAVAGTGVLVLNGATTVYSTDFGGQLNVTNTGNFSVVGSGFALGDSSGGVVAVTNAATGTMQFTTDAGVSNGNNASSSITNAGLLSKSGGYGTSVISVMLANQSGGTISVASGSMQAAGTMTNAGTITGAGQFDVTGSATLAGGTSLSVGQFGIYNAGQVTLATSLVFGGIFSDGASFNTTVLALGGNTLTLNGASSFEGYYGTDEISGTGSLVLNGDCTAFSADFGGQISVINIGDFSAAGSGLSLGDSSGGVVDFANSATGTLQFTTDNGLANGNNASSFIANAGLLSKSGGNGTSSIGVVLDNQSGGTVSVSSGSLQIAGTLNNAGAISGAGQLDVTGSATLAAGTSLTVGQFGIYNAGQVALATSLSYNGIFSDNSSFNNTVLNLGANTLTLSGTQDSFVGYDGSVVLSGTGTLVATNGATLSVANMVVGGAASFSNDGTVNQSGTVTIGDGSGQVADITNASGSTWTIANGYTINNGSASASGFTNAGLVTITAGNSQAIFATTFTNQAGGTIDVATGSLGDNYVLTNAGTITGNDFAINSNARAILAAGSQITTASFDMFSNSTLTLTGDQTYGGTFNDTSYGIAVNLGANTLQMTGTANFIGDYGNTLISGSGTLATSGTTNLSNVTLGGTADFINAGTLTAGGGLQLGDGSNNAATFVNTAAGIYDVVNDGAYVQHGSSLLSDFMNEGLFEKTAGTGTTVISSAFTNDGTITVTSGTLEFTAGSLVNNGTINGAVTTDNNGNVFITHQ